MDEASKVNLNEDRFLRLLMNSQRRIYAYIIASVHNIADADDIMQDVSTVMWHRYEDYDPDGNFTAWGIGIARKSILNFYSKKKRSRVLFDEEMLQALESIARSKFDEADRRTEFLKQCVDQLGEKERKLIELRYNRNLKSATIAHRVGLSVYVVYRAITKIHGLLQLCIQRKMREEGVM